MDNVISQYDNPEDMTVRRLDNGRMFHLWVIGITPLTSGKKLDAGVNTVTK